MGRLPHLQTSGSGLKRFRQTWFGSGLGLERRPLSRSCWASTSAGERPPLLSRPTTRSRSPHRGHRAPFGPRPVPLRVVSRGSCGVEIWLVDLGHQGGRGTPHKTFEFLSRSCQTGCSGGVASCRGDCGCGKTWQHFDGELSTAKLPRERETPLGKDVSTLRSAPVQARPRQDRTIPPEPAQGVPGGRRRQSEPSGAAHGAHGDSSRATSSRSGHGSRLPLVSQTPDPSSARPISDTTWPWRASACTAA